MTSDRTPSDVVLSLRSAGLRLGGRTLWDGLDLDVHAGELVAVLGANGTGKTSLLRAILGRHRLTHGRAELLGHPVGRGHHAIGYVPQQTLAAGSTPLRARDLVALGLDGHRWGPGRPSRARSARVDELLDSVGASAYAEVPLSLLSGGEQQRLRVAQALAGRPRLLLCDEPLLSLDLAHQRAISSLIDRARHERSLGVLFVTHDINPVLTAVDRVLYLAGGRFRIGTPAEVLQTDVLTGLYGSPVEVIRTHGRIVVVGTDEAPQAHPDRAGHDGHPLHPDRLAVRR